MCTVAKSFKSDIFGYFSKMAGKMFNFCIIETLYTS